MVNCARIAIVANRMMNLTSAPDLPRVSGAFSLCVRHFLLCIGLLCGTLTRDPGIADAETEALRPVVAHFRRGQLMQPMNGIAHRLRCLLIHQAASSDDVSFRCA